MRLLATRGHSVRLGPVSLLCALQLAVGCAAPVGVKRVDARSVHRSLVANVLSTGEPSAASTQTLNRKNLFERFGNDPEGATVSPTVNASSVRSRETSFARASESGLSPKRNRTPAKVTSNPAAPPAPARAKPSVRSCRASRAGPAPNAARTANSRCRAMLRARNRFATLTHAMSNTNPAAPINT